MGKTINDLDNSDHISFYFIEWWIHINNNFHDVIKEVTELL